MKRQIFSLFLLLLTLVACGDKPLDPNKPVYVKIKTTMGDVTVLLYDVTPLHRDNFIKLCQSNEYEGMLFHRVIKVVIRRVRRMSRVPCMGMAMVVIPVPPRYYPIILIRKAL